MIAALALALSLAASPALPAHPFEVPASLLPAVGFWVRVYAEWPSTTVAIHDSAHVEVIYRVLDLAELEVLPNDSTLARQAKAAQRMEAVAQAKKEVEDALDVLDGTRPNGPRGLKGVVKDVYLAWEAYAGNPGRFGAAANRVRTQRGISDKYANGYRNAGRFMGAVQAALRDAGHPEGLVALSFTESLMNVHARSVSGALGPWQFLKGTGKEYMAINAVVDERKDPVLSTLAAARYLHNSKERLGSWGAAITAYNYGTNGMERAVRKLGTSDLETILREHSSKSFGFAAKNYYAEFLASLHVLSHADRYFQGVTPLPAWKFDAVVLPAPVSVDVLLGAGVDPDVLADFNPALTKEALQSEQALPKGLTLRVPAGKGAALLARIPRLTAEADPPPRPVTVKAGESLMLLVRRHGVSMGEICAENGLRAEDPLQAGATLRIPLRHMGYSQLPETSLALRKGNVVAVSFPPPQALARHAPSLLAMQQQCEPVMVAYNGPGIPMPRPPRSLSTMLVTALRPVPLEAPFEPLVMASHMVLGTGLPTSISVHGVRITAGPATQQQANLDEDDAVDVITGDTSLPEVDVVAGGLGEEPQAPLVLPPVRDVGSAG